MKGSAKAGPFFLEKKKLCRWPDSNLRRMFVVGLCLVYFEKFNTITFTAVPWMDKIRPHSSEKRLYQTGEDCVHSSAKTFFSEIFSKTHSPFFEQQCLNQLTNI